MTREKLIELAREAGYQEDMFGFGIWDSKEFNAFAALVAAAERNRTWTQNHWTEYERSIVATEREAIATEFMKRHEAVKHLNNYWHHAAVYVRERGQHD
jgi:hypothetical protein